MRNKLRAFETFLEIIAEKMKVHKTNFFLCSDCAGFLTLQIASIRNEWRQIRPVKGQSIYKKEIKPISKGLAEGDHLIIFYPHMTYWSAVFWAKREIL